jgi:predicted GIY-YIG superfamily endonuclease
MGREFESPPLRPAPFGTYEIFLGAITMYYVYLLKKYNDDEIYIGHTNNLKRRFNEHNRAGKIWELLYYEAYKARKDAEEIEALWQSAWSIEKTSTA